jgi:hypothetical protein
MGKVARDLGLQREFDADRPAGQHAERTHGSNGSGGPRNGGHRNGGSRNGSRSGSGSRRRSRSSRGRRSRSA